MARMRILTANEQQAFDKPPLFDHRDRKKYFDLPKGLMDIAKSLRAPGGQIGFLVMCGYFKATNPHEYTLTEKEEQEIAEACNRLIRNAIICWNYLYLARQIEKAPDADAQKNLLRLIAANSPMSWAHINMLGEYDFSEEKLRDTLGILPPKKVA